MKPKTLLILLGMVLLAIWFFRPKAAAATPAAATVDDLAGTVPMAGIDIPILPYQL